MNQKTENTGLFLSRVILIIALVLLFFVKSEKISTDHHPKYCYTHIEVKANSQAIPIVSSEIPIISWFSVIKAFKINPVFRPALETSFRLNITEKLHRCSMVYFNAKLLVLKSRQKQMLPRHPDPEDSLLS